MGIQTALAWIAHRKAFAFVAGAFVIACILRLNDVSVYTPDSCRYVVVGNSLAHGQGWLDPTKPDPERFMINPPLYSLLIAPVELLFPLSRLSLIAVKIWTVLWGLLSVILLYEFLRRTLGGRAAAAGAFIFALNPLLVIFASEALSDAPFLAFLMLALLACETGPSREAEESPNVFALGLCATALPLIREAGIAAVIAAAAYLASRRRIGQAVIILLFAASLLALWYVRNQAWSQAENGSQATNPSILFRQYFTSPGSSFLEEFAYRLWYSLKAYIPQAGAMLFDTFGAGQLSDLIINPSPVYRGIAFALDALKPGVIVFTLGLVLFGAYRDVRESPTASLRMVFVCSYAAVILIFPAHDIRYLLPCLPLAVYYFLRGAKGLLSARPVRDRYVVAAAALLMIPNLAGIYETVSANLAYNFAPERLINSPTLPAAFRYQWKRTESWIRDHVPENVVIATPVKDIVLASGNRKILEMDPGVTLAEFEALVRNNRVEYLFAPAQWKDLRSYEFPMRESRRFWFEPMPEARNFMKVHSRFIEPKVLTPPHEPFDTLSPTELLRRGRNELVRGNYRSASLTLHRVLLLAPMEAEVLYQVMVADLMAGDTVDAQEQYRKILTVQQTYSYIDHGRSHWDAIELLAGGRASTVPEDRAVKSFEAASLYWNLGYPRRAAELLDTMMSADSSYFFGLLWGVNINLRLGDTSRAKAYLTRLRAIDATNSVVKAFEQVFDLCDSLTLTPRAGERSRLHFGIASLYDRIGLADEAFDEAEMAIGENPGRIDALLLIAQLLERRSRSLAAEKAYGQVLIREPGNRLAIARIDSLRRRPSGE